MKRIAEMTAEELGAFVCQTLAGADIKVTLTGGACVAIWSNGKYVSKDLDFIEEGPVPRTRVRSVMKSIGFQEEGRYFTHSDTKFFVEFPTGPLSIGNERIERFSERNTVVGKLRLLSPTDCVKDRLAAFYHWKDRPSLEQALLVARDQEIDLSDVQMWSIAEGQEARFEEFEERLKAFNRPARGGSLE
jgi:hypothetical protein